MLIYEKKFIFRFDVFRFLEFSVIYGKNRRRALVIGHRVLLALAGVYRDDHNITLRSLNILYLLSYYYHNVALTGLFIPQKNIHRQINLTFQTSRYKTQNTVQKKPDKRVSLSSLLLIPNKKPILLSLCLPISPTLLLPIALSPFRPLAHSNFSPLKQYPATL